MQLDTNVYIMYTQDMKKAKETKTDLMHIRIEPSLKADLEKAARLDGRTMAGAVLHLIKGYVSEILKKK